MSWTGKDAMTVIGVCGLLLLGASMGQAQTVYVEGSSNEFGLLDVATGNFTLLGNTQRTIFGMGFAVDGSLYGLTSGPNARLQTIDPANASTTTLGRIGQVASTATMRDGTFYVLTNEFSSAFYSLAPPALLPSFINSSLPFSEDGLIAFDGQGNLFAGSADATGNDMLYQIDPTTGASVLLGDTGFFGIEAGIFLNGTLYGFDSAGEILTLDTTSGLGTLIGTYNLPDADAIVAIAARPAAVPEPGSIALLLSLSMTGAGFLARHRKHARRAA